MLLEKLSIHAWIQVNQIKTETGQNINFSTHRFLFDIYRDNSKYICCEKAAQIGFTTFEILNSFWKAYYQGMDIIYVLPTATDVKDFAGGKVNRIIDQNPILQKWVKDKDSVEQKRVGNSTIYYRGSWSERAALMISADWLVLDEYDRSKQEILEMYESRLQHSKHGKKSVFSNPSIPDFGVDKYFKLSDQKKWHITHSCGKNYVMNETCINYDNETYECPHCHKEILDEERRMGEWIATTKGEWSGYWIPLWIASWVTAKQICEYKRTKTPEYFCNFVAGLPYVGSGNKVTREMIVQNLTPEVNQQEDRIIIGVDTGLPIHYVIGNKQGMFYYGKCDNYDELEGYLKRWKNSIIVSDQGGDLIGIRQLQQKYPGRVFLCYYRADRKTQQLIQWGEGDEYGKVVVDRNRIIQLQIDELKDKRFPINGSESDWNEYITHWLNIYRTREENALGIMEYKWERMGADHFVHCTVYFRVGLDKYATALATIVGKDKTLECIPTGRIMNIGENPQYYKPNL